MNDHSTQQVCNHVAHNLRDARQRLGWSQEKLATAADVSRRMLVNIEAGASNVSIATLDRLSGALGLTFSELVRPPGSEAPVRVWQGNSQDSHATLLHSLALPNCTLELWQWQLAPGDSYQATPDPAGCGEIVEVYSGTLQLRYADTALTLLAGATAGYSTGQGYRYHNPGRTLLRFQRSIVMPAPLLP
ncbi:helix-turn-helix transcriptional regulator [Vogesella sp. LIG4]|uniref:helix-turn-helix transcriptional regulator n=1 Tax=Vogesella sp. LIG4 TaxID=1192162 RepID=UPI00081FE2AD|nr:helix-turn-helix transcriptional regulator [Vogesella sp. LIG4]SCK15732.1 transcriptional regulator, XRE family with cupin sensor [Vogesella sp. LIG4]